MRRRTSPDIVERAIIVVPEFKNVIKKLSTQVTLPGPIKRAWLVLISPVKK